MIVLKYSKTFPVSMASHIDLLNIINKVFRRMQLKVNYSMGYNPHTIMFFTPALSLGVDSDCEYMCVDAMLTSDFLEKFNTFSPKGLVGQKVFEVTKNPNFANFVTSAEYEITMQDIGKIDLEKAMQGDFIIVAVTKDAKTEKNVSDKIFSITKIDDNKLKCQLACGNNNLKADRFLEGLCKKTNITRTDYTIIKTNMFIEKVEIEEFVLGQ